MALETSVPILSCDGTRQQATFTHNSLVTSYGLLYSWVIFWSHNHVVSGKSKRSDLRSTWFSLEQRTSGYFNLLYNVELSGIAASTCGEYRYLVRMSMYCMAVTLRWIEQNYLVNAIPVFYSYICVAVYKGYHCTKVDVVIGLKYSSVWNSTSCWPHCKTSKWRHRNDLTRSQYQVLDGLTGTAVAGWLTDWLTGESWWSDPVYSIIPRHDMYIHGITRLVISLGSYRPDRVESSDRIRLLQLCCCLHRGVVVHLRLNEFDQIHGIKNEE